ncbi:hypothetical protein Tco_0848643 [Tanacetum coccineum]
MDLMSRGYKPYLDKFIDDISICSSRNEEHEEHLRHTLETFKNKKLYAKFSKYEFWPPEVQFLDHIKEKVIAYNPRQLEVPEKNYPTPDLEIGEIVFSFKIWERYLDSIPPWKSKRSSRTERAKPLRVRALVMTINSNLPPQIHKTQVESLKTENVKDENLHGIDNEFENRLDGTLYIRRRSRLPRVRDLGKLIKHEPHKPNYFIHPGIG